MHGDVAEGSPGLISMIVADLFERVSKCPELKSKVNVSFVEMYNDKIFDLMVKKVDQVALRIREHRTLGPFVDGASLHDIASADQFEELRATACKRMRTAPTEISKSSSRSHTVVTLTWDTVEAADGAGKSAASKSRKMVLPQTTRHCGLDK